VASRFPLLPALVFTILFTSCRSRQRLLQLHQPEGQDPVDHPEPTKFVGIDNYRAIFNDPFFRQAMWTSVKMTVLAVVLSLVFGTLFALLLDRRFFGQGIVRTLLITPFLLMRSSQR